MDERFSRTSPSLHSRARLRAWHVIGAALVALAMGLLSNGCTRAVIVPPSSYDIVEPRPGHTYELTTTTGEDYATTALERIDSTFVIRNRRQAAAEYSVRRIESIEPVTLRLDQVRRLRRFESGADYRRAPLTVGDRVRIEHSGGELTVGRVRDVGYDGVRVETDWNDTVDVPVPVINRIERYNPGTRNIAQTTVVGLMVGMGVGLLAAQTDGDTGYLGGLMVALSMGVGMTGGLIFGCVVPPEDWNAVDLRDLGGTEPPSTSVFGGS